MQGFVDALDSQITTILAEQLNVTWENYIHNSVFSGKLSDAQVRQRDLLLELSAFEKPIFANELRKRLSDKLLAEYDKKTLRAFHRDINDLERRNLVVRAERNIYAAKYRMRAFLPICRQHKDA